MYDTSTDGPPAQFHGDVLVSGGMLLVPSDAEPVGHLYAFELGTGRLAWKLAFPGGVPAQVLGRGKLVYAQAASGEVWALDRRTGKRAWMHAAASQSAAGFSQADPALAGDRLVVVWPSGDVEALKASSGKLLWRASIGARPNTSLLVVGANVLVGAMDSKLHRFALADGTAMSPIALAGTPFGDLVVADRCLLVLTMLANYTLSCRDPERGELTWERSFNEELTTFRPLRWGDDVIVGYRGTLLGLRLEDGADAWSCTVDGMPRGLNAAGDELYVGTFAGVVMALPRRAITRDCARSAP